ncbi:MAG: HDIG domain-containing protein [Caldisericia bacterium]|nr:HDIG domain-containing protein [Caldisericia bacterium]MDD4615026.1 HDIG domain-containing protein [Caldisericia bacterium]
MERQEAIAMWKEYNAEEHLFRHALAVEGAMRAYAKKYDQDIELWGICGLLHDIDFEQYPREHPAKGVEILQNLGCHPDMVQAVKEHAMDMDHRETLLSRALYACDEMASFVVAVGMVRPEGLEGMKPSSVTKKMKNKQFAAKVDREQLVKSAEDLGEEISEHIQVIINGLQEHEKRVRAMDGFALLTHS